jgi:hypothetical protein
MNDSTKRDRALTTINVVIWMFLIAAALLSSTHIVQTGQRLGLGWEAWTLPMFVDGIALVGKVSMLKRFSRAFRRSGFRLLMLGGTLSLACNVYAGENLGQRIFGVLVVAGFMLLESHATKAGHATAIEHNAPHAPAAAPVSPGMPPAADEPANVLAYRQAAEQLRKTSTLAALNSQAA